MKQVLTIYLLILVGLNQHIVAQQLILSGEILFERRENIHKGMTEENSWTEARKKATPKYKVDLFSLQFNTKQSIYKMHTEDEHPSFMWNKMANSNSVLQLFDNRLYEAEKTIYEKSYRVKDSLPTYTWKLENEFRTIAGHSCRKASTIILDSLYIMAFYTDEIPVSGGPESFNGLPGMILGIVVPRINTTYFATKVSSQLIPENNYTLPKSKSKTTLYKDFYSELGKALKDWGEYASQVIWRASL
ncbi:MAG: GLPGLI family protein [Bacteroidia bacterium]|nr:GLPGLI family protein [Bacteroidia bacterium]